MTGKLIVIDGCDATGKATQTRMLAKRLSDENHAVIEHSFPKYEHPSSLAVRIYLARHGISPEICLPRELAMTLDPKIVSAWYALDRACHAPEMRAQLATGAILVSDRYTSANAGHQGGKIADPQKRKEYLDWLFSFEYEKLQIPQPDLTILLDLEPEVSEQLLSARPGEKDLHEKDPAHQRNARDAFLYAAEKQAHWRVIRCTKPLLEGVLNDQAILGTEKIRPANEIHEELYALVYDLLKK